MHLRTSAAVSPADSRRLTGPVEHTVKLEGAPSSVIHVAIECRPTGDRYAEVQTRNVLTSFGALFVEATVVEATFAAAMPRPESRRVIAATFRRACDATHAVTELVRLFAEHPTNRQSEIGLRVGFCVGASSGDAVARKSAAELLSHAGAFQVLTTSATAAAAGPTLPPGAELVDRGVTDVGFDRPERIYELRVHRAEDGGGASNLDWARRVADLRTPLPDDRVAELIETWKSALDDGHAVVQLTSSDGFLATAAAAELALRVHADGALVLRGSWDQHAPRPYGAFREALGIYAAECSPSRVRADVDRRVWDIARLLPELGARLGTLPPWEPERFDDCHRVGDALSEWLKAIAVREDLILVLDHVQWADQSSLALCEQLSEDLTPHRLLIALCGAEEDMREHRVLDAVTALATDAGGREAWINFGPP